MSAFTVRRLGYALGAEIRGVDLRSPLDDRTVAELRKTWLEHIVLCFPEQKLENEDFRRFCRYFGELDTNPNSPVKLPEFPELMHLGNKPLVLGEKKLDRFYAGSQWHSDRQVTDRPASGTFLLAKQLPDVGGNTLYANQYLAFETLSPAMQRLIEPLEAVHDGVKSVDYASLSPEVREQKRRTSPPVVHPLVRIHPETQRKALFAGRRVRKFTGMTEEESAPLVDFLNEHAVRYEFQYRHVWTVDDLVMWDNRCALHYAVQDYDQSQVRRMVRCSLLPPKSGYVYDEAGDMQLATAGR